MKKNHILKEEKNFVSLTEAAEYLDLQKSTLYAYCRQRLIPFYKVNGRKNYFLRQDLDNFIINDRNLVKSQRQIEVEAEKHLREMRSGGVI